MVCNFNVNYKIQTNRSFQRLVLLYVSSHKRDNFDEKRVHELLFWNFTCRCTKSDCNVLQGLRIKGTDCTAASCKRNSRKPICFHYWICEKFNFKIKLFFRMDKRIILTIETIVIIKASVLQVYMYAKSNVYKIPNALSISLITDDEDRVTGNGLTLVTVSVDVSVTAAVQVIGAVVVILVLSKRGLEHDDHCQCGGLVDELAYWLHFDCFRLLKDSSLERWVKNHCQGFVYIVSKLSKTTLFFFQIKRDVKIFCDGCLWELFNKVYLQERGKRCCRFLGNFLARSLFISFTI